jgi:hypothetical protein
MKNVIFACLTLIGYPITINAQLPDYVPSNGLISWWKFSGNANDLSGHGHDGIVNGPVLTEDRYLMPNSAYFFNGGNDEILIGGDPAFEVNVFTVSGWVKTPSTITDYQTMFSFYTNPAPVQYSGYWVGIFNKRACLFLGNHDPGFNITGTDTINDDHWHFIAATFNEDQRGTIYVDGVLQNIQKKPMTIDTAIAQIGNSVLNEIIIGSLDDIGIWNRVLTEEELSNLYKGCVANILTDPADQSAATGDSVSFFSESVNPDASYQWQTDFGLGFQNVEDVNQYAGSATVELTVHELQLRNHIQPFRLIASSSICSDTSAAAFLYLTDTCIVTVQDTQIIVIEDTTFVTITDTSYIEIFDTTFIEIVDTTHISVTDTSYLTITDTTHIQINDTSYISVTDTLIIHVDLSSVPPQPATNDIKLYPNPASTHLTIDNGDYAAMNGYRIRIDNIASVNVFDKSIDAQKFEIDLSTWTGKGLYFVTLFDPQGNSVVVKKIVLQ